MFKLDALDQKHSPSLPYDPSVHGCLEFPVIKHLMPILTISSHYQYIQLSIDRTAYENDTDRVCDFSWPKDLMSFPHLEKIKHTIRDPVNSFYKAWDAVLSLVETVSSVEILICICFSSCGFIWDR